jgi:steroid delta-isomerase-like uncharacterized protein
VTDDDTARLARRWFEEVWNERHVEMVDELAAPDCLGHHEDGDTHGREEWKRRMYGEFVAAIPDVRVVVEDVIAAGAYAVVRWRFSGTHSGFGAGLPPTGRRVDVRGMTWFRFEHGKIVEGWDCWNIGGFRERLS